jgi:hypothetical protein
MLAGDRNAALAYLLCTRSTAYVQDKANLSLKDVMSCTLLLLPVQTEGSVKVRESRMIITAEMHRKLVRYLHNFLSSRYGRMF